jgi:hypothetical protein
LNPEKACSQNLSAVLLKFIQDGVMSVFKSFYTISFQ